VAGFGLQSAVTPLGRLDSENVTLPENPYWPLTETEADCVCPWPRLTVPGPDRVNVGEKTLSVIVVVAVRLPDVPVIVSVLLPVLVVLLAVKVRVLAPDAGLGEKEAVTPLGKPETLKFTFPLNPYWLLM